MRARTMHTTERPSTVNFLMEPPRKAGSIISIRTASFENRCRSSAPSELAPYSALCPSPRQRGTPVAPVFTGPAEPVVVRIRLCVTTKLHGHRQNT